MRVNIFTPIAIAALLTAPLFGTADDAAPQGAAPSARIGSSPLDQAIAEAFRAAYSLDHDAAVAAARRAVAMAPDEARAHRTLASIVWLDILFRRGAVTVDHYLGSAVKAQLNVPKPPLELDAEFKREIGKAISLAEAALSRSPRDVDARYDLGSALGVQASYTASVEGSLSSAFRSAKRAYDAQEEVLTRDPGRLGAGVIVGTYRYAVSALSLPSRMFAYMVGFGGDKEKGIRMIEAAMQDPAGRVDARTALLLIFSREGRHRDALRIVRELETEFPSNRLFVLEEGASAIRAGLADQAEIALTRGLAMFERDPRRKVPGERALWLYKRGLARVNLNRPADARVDLDEALRSDPLEWVRGRIHVELGKVADLAGRRAEALDSYRLAKSIAEAANDPASAAEASRWLRRPFTPGGR